LVFEEPGIDLGYGRGFPASLSGKNLANNGPSSHKCGSLAELPEGSDAGIVFLEGASASESDFA